MLSQRRVVAIVAVTQLTNYILPLVTFPLLVKSFEVNQYGIWIEAGTLTGLTIAFIANALNAGTIAVTMNQPHHRDLIFSNAFYLFGLVCGSLSLLVLIAAPTLNLLIIRQSEGVLIIQITAVMIVVGAFNELTGSIFRFRYQASQASIFVIALAIARVLSALYAAYQRDLPRFAFFYVGLQFTLTVFEVIIAYRGIKFHAVSWQILRQIVKNALTLSIVTQANWLVMYGDRLMLSVFASSTSVAIYAASYQISAILIAVGAPFLYSLLPNIGERWKEQDISGMQRLIRQSTRFMFIFLIPAVVGLTLIGDALLQLLATKDFAQGAFLVGMITIGVAIETLGNSLQFIFHAQGRPKVLRRIYLQAAVLNILANLIIIPLFSYNGAGFTTMVTFIFVFWSLWRETKMSFRVLFDVNVVWRCVTASLLMGVWVIPIVAPTIPRLLAAVSGGAFIYGAGLLLLRVVSWHELIAQIQFIHQRLTKGQAH